MDFIIVFGGDEIKLLLTASNCETVIIKYFVK